MKQKEIVRLREKELANGTRSLYLDIYLNGKRKYEFLKLYLLPETSREAKAENKRTMILANAVQKDVITLSLIPRFARSLFRWWLLPA